MEIPQIDEKKEHWKVGDGVDLGDERFHIGQIVVVNIGYPKYRIDIYDTRGKVKLSAELIKHDTA